MAYLIDTNIAIHARDGTDAVLDRLAKHDGEVPVLPFDASAAAAYGWIIARCGWARGRDYDRMMAGHAMSSGAILVTNNEADFRDIPGLVMENWIV